MTDTLMIKPEDVKQLREQTGAGIMDCKRALTESGGDVDKATALEFAPDPEKLKMAFKGIKVAASGILS